MTQNKTNEHCHNSINHTRDPLGLAKGSPFSGIDHDIDNTILKCKQCQNHLPSNTKKPITQKLAPGRPFQEIAVLTC